MSILKKYWLGVLVFSLFVAAAFLIYAKLHPPALGDNLIQGSGRIDGDLVNLNAKYPGRIARMEAREGQQVKKGETIARIESREHDAQRSQIAAQIAAKKQERNARAIELDIARKTLPQAVVKARANLERQLRMRDELDASIRIQKSIAEQSLRDRERFRDLVEKRLVEVRQLETAALKYQSDADALKALEFKRLQLDEAIRIAHSEEAEAQAAQQKIAALEAAERALEEGIRSLEASLEQSDALLSEMVLRSPLDGFVVEKVAHEGEVIGGGSPVATLIDPGSLYLKIFVDTLQNGRIKVGDKGVIFLDASPERPIEATVVRVEQKAEFTPKEVSVASDRIQRVFAVHLRPVLPDPLLKLGLPAVGIISTDGKGLPRSLREVPE